MVLGRLWVLVIGVSLTGLGGCGLSSQTVTMTSGQEGSAYQRISEQVKRSAEQVKDVQVEDRNDSRGSADNLRRVVEEDVMFALVQLDVVRPALREGKVQTLGILAREHFHLIARADSDLETILDLQGKRVAMGQEGSGTFFTAERLLSLASLEVVPEKLSFSQGRTALAAGEVEAIAYVGTIGMNDTVRSALEQSGEESELPLKLLRIPAPVANYITAKYPESYHQTVIPEGIYNPIQTQPPEDIPAIATGTALITGKKTDPTAIGLTTWAILSTARQYAVFYPELAEGDPRELLQRNSLYTAKPAQQVYDHGDPRNAWLRSIQENETIQEYALALMVTSAVGLLLGWWRQRRSSAVLRASKEAIAQLRATLEQEPQDTAEGIMQLLQQYRLMSLDGAISPDAYEQVSQKLGLLEEQARALLEGQRQQKIGDTVGLLDAVDSHLCESPEERRQAMNEIDRQYRTLLKSGEVDLSTYLQLRQLGILQLGLLAGECDPPTQGSEGSTISPPVTSKPMASEAKSKKSRPLPKPTPVMPPPRPPMPMPPAEPPSAPPNP